MNVVNCVAEEIAARNYVYVVNLFVMKAEINPTFEIIRTIEICQNITL